MSMPLTVTKVRRLVRGDGGGRGVGWGGRVGAASFIISLISHYWPFVGKGVLKMELQLNYKSMTLQKRLEV